MEEMTCLRKHLVVVVVVEVVVVAVSKVHSLDRFDQIIINTIHKIR